jgi:hypothetical protein
MKRSLKHTLTLPQRYTLKAGAFRGQARRHGLRTTANRPVRNAKLTRWFRQHPETSDLTTTSSSSERQLPPSPLLAHSTTAKMFAQRALARSTPRLGQVARAPARQTRKYSSESPKRFAGGEDNEFNRERARIQEHAAESGGE